MSLGADGMLSRHTSMATTDPHAGLGVVRGKRISPAVEPLDQIWLETGMNLVKGESIGGRAIVGIVAMAIREVPPNLALAVEPARVVLDNVTSARPQL